MENIVDIRGPTPQEKFTCQRKFYSQVNYPYFENKILTFLTSESKKSLMGSWPCFKTEII